MIREIMTLQTQYDQLTNIISKYASENDLIGCKRELISSGLSDESKDVKEWMRNYRSVQEGRIDLYEIAEKFLELNIDGYRDSDDYQSDITELAIYDFVALLVSKKIAIGEAKAFKILQSSIG